MTNIDIDYIVPMVFPDDPKWRHDLLTATGTYHDDRSAVTNVRYRSWNTEPILIDLIRKNLPWLRTIHIILARPSQLQPWMRPLLSASSASSGFAAQPTAPSASSGSAARTPSVRVVYHRDFIPSRHLPTFNSRTIEMFLHRIPGLAPYFLYGNDDMFPISPLPVTAFFRPASAFGGSAAETNTPILPCLHPTDKRYNPTNGFHQACMNGMNFVAAPFNRQFTDHWLHFGHNIIPNLRSTCEMFWQRYPKQITASITTFRLPQNFNQYIYPWYHVLANQYIDHRPPSSYVSTKNSTEEILTAIATAKGLLCINDNEAATDITGLAAAVRRELHRRL